jgi:Peptidase C39 family
MRNSTGCGKRYIHTPQRCGHGNMISKPVLIVAAALYHVLLAVSVYVVLSVMAGRGVVAADLAESKWREKSSVANEGDALWRSGRVCGVNCVYLMLRVAGRRPDYAVLSKQLLGDKANSLTDLQSAARRWGVELELARLNASELRRAPKPLIAHFEAVDLDGVERGHFVIVMRATDGGVDCIDGTDGGQTTRSWAEFERLWTGYVAFYGTESTRHAWMALGGGCVAFACGAVAALAYGKGRKRSKCENGQV